MFRTALLLGILTSALSAKAETVSQNWTNFGGNRDEQLSRALFQAPPTAYYIRNGWVRTTGSEAGRPALLANWRSINSRQTVTFILDRTSQVSLRARSTRGGYYEATASCNRNGVCQAEVKKVRFGEPTAALLKRSMSVSRGIPEQMTLVVEDLQRANPNETDVKLSLTVDNASSEFIDRGISHPTGRNPHHGVVGEVGFIIQGAETAISFYQADYLPHFSGRVCYRARPFSGNLRPTEKCTARSSPSDRAFTTALPNEMVPGLVPIHSLSTRAQSPYNIVYLTQSYGEVGFLISRFGYVSNPTLGLALPEFHCRGNTKEIIHRYNPRSDQHIFSNNPRLLLTETNSREWETHGSLGCSIE